MGNNWSNYILHDQRDDTDLGVSRAFRFDINDHFKNIQIKDRPFDGLCKLRLVFVSIWHGDSQLQYTIS